MGLPHDHGRRQLIKAAALAPALVALPCAAQPAASFPSRPVRCVVGFPPGGAVDANARVITQKLSEYWKQPVVVENRGGAGSTIGARVVATAPADGYTFLIVSPAHAINATLYKKLPFDTEKAFAPVAKLTSSPLIVYVHPSVQARSIAELIALAKAQPGRLNYASSGSGTSTHLAAALFNQSAETDIVHVPFSGGGPAYTTLIAGDVQLHFGGLEGLQHVRSGRLRALAVTTAKRFPMTPELPTIAESGLNGFEVQSWYGVYVPAGTPQAIVEKLNADINHVLQLPEVRDQYARMGFEIEKSTPEQFAAFTRQEIEKWRGIVISAKLQVD
jgi:tripartite-type tricarboxylate transporter receptor subunit TctC